MLPWSVHEQIRFLRLSRRLHQLVNLQKVFLGFRKTNQDYFQTKVGQILPEYHIPEFPRDLYSHPDVRYVVLKRVRHHYQLCRIRQ